MQHGDSYNVHDIFFKTDKRLHGTKGNYEWEYIQNVLNNNHSVAKIVGHFQEITVIN